MRTSRGPASHAAGWRDGGAPVADPDPGDPPTELEAEPPELVAEAVAALGRALTGAVTDADLDVLDSAMCQSQVHVDAQRGVTSRVTYDVTDDHPGQTSGRPDSRGARSAPSTPTCRDPWVCHWRR